VEDLDQGKPEGGHTWRARPPAGKYRTLVYRLHPFAARLRRNLDRKCRISDRSYSGHGREIPQVVPHGPHFVQCTYLSGVFPSVADRLMTMNHTERSTPIEGALIQSVVIVDRLTRAVPGTFRAVSLPGNSA